MTMIAYYHQMIRLITLHQHFDGYNYNNDMFEINKYSQVQSPYYLKHV